MIKKGFTWAEAISSYLLPQIKAGSSSIWVQEMSCKSYYICRKNKASNKIVMLILYVDDSVVTGNDIYIKKNKKKKLKGLKA